MKFLKKIDALIYWLSLRVLVLSIFCLIAFSSFGIITRWFNFSYLWTEPLIRHIVFLVIFLGGLIATEKQTHVSIDLLSRYLEGNERKKAKRIINIFVASTTLLIVTGLIYASINFIKIELAFGKEIFWGIHSGFLVMIIPIGLFSIALKLIVKIIEMLWPTKETTWPS
ncbi:MAG: hypothetical protein A2504_03575 [Bdellovibrionales bacterium RIFOXYD12_FULL_39_22]|nr:MAG: hypothetical protein A2385_11325 [Bdellovibrionales bacterium RIFOXYB1_FULL_39_21]OFZ41660.1 MAG: hypothetical protein A2485_01635 [Bdellovibrionales bacterium RIFOXYC12_FULL_39_17]OFZ46060.1 MAG: hypothetical protein A2404_12000 [Bdellovibrionales bacterium RIFOXYC1_FULL_39_130]OFZ74887.1 MAG: hypothetical protein A2560_15040 [Bdellovibrionales bacterium RIFOXYD1_FULL_39_84]OFZ92740.1 MAG: hypothetical protein A2504_03575 [Bdellovibrionales bacterium RIFOXYD12_FULL_39_22]HLE12521.1 TR